MQVCAGHISRLPNVTQHIYLSTEFTENTPLDTRMTIKSLRFGIGDQCTDIAQKYNL